MKIKRRNEHLLRLNQYENFILHYHKSDGAHGWHLTNTWLENQHTNKCFMFIKSKGCQMNNKNDYKASEFDKQKSNSIFS